jgi:Tol biopolymer transport system component
MDVIPTARGGRGVAVTPRRYGQYTGALSWSPDSRRMLIEAQPDRSFDWYTVAPDGRDRRRLLHLRQELSGNHAWSPDSGRIAYVGLRGGIFVIDANGGRPRRIAATQSRGRDAWHVYLDWSSRGEIAFSDKDGTYVMRDNGTGVRRLSKRTGEPDWSPNGQRLVLSEGKQIFVIDRLGRERQLTRWLSDADPQVSPDGGRVAFVRGNGVYVKNPSVYVMNAKGSGQHRLGPGRDPRWSPDGSRVAYVEGRATPRNDRIFVADRNGRGMQAVTEGQAPTWSPDGRLAFMRYEYVFEDRGDHGGAQWYVVKSTLVTARADGGGERTVAAFDPNYEEGPVTASAPAWSRDGRTIAVVFGGVLLIDPEDGTQRTLGGLSGHEADALEWSPDGTRILAWDYNTIWLIDAATGTTTRILELSGGISLEGATWSPDAATIGFVRCTEDEVCDVYTVAAQAGAKSQRLTRTPGVEVGLDWGP